MQDSLAVFDDDGSRNHAQDRVLGSLHLNRTT